MLRRLLAKAVPLEQVETLVQQELAAILSICAPRRVYLFGSAARGEMTDASDLDFLIAMPDQSDLKVVKKAYYCRRRGHDWPVDTIFMTQQSFEERSRVGGVAMICAQEGRLLYSRTETL